MNDHILGLSFDNEKLHKIVSGVIIISMIGQIILLAYVNMTKTDQFDLDSSLAIRHGIEIWRNRSLFLDGFNYFSTLEIDNAGFFAIPLYLLFHNMGLGLAVCHVIIYLCFLLVCCDIFKIIGMRWECGALATIFLFTPYAFGQLDCSNMMFFMVGQYEFRVLVLLLLIDLMVRCEKTVGLRDALVWVSCLCLNFWTSLSCGNYVLLMIIFPIFLWLLTKGISEIGWRYKPIQLAALFSNIVVSLAGWKIHDAFAGVSSNNEKNLVAAASFMDNLEDMVSGIFMLFGGLKYSGDISILSLEGILTVLKFAFVIFCIGFMLTHIRKWKNIPIIGILGAVIFVNIGVLSLANTTYGSPIFEYRYHIIWAAMMLLCVGTLYEYFTSLKYGRTMMSLLLLAVVAFNVAGYQNLANAQPLTSLAEEILNIADDDGYDTIYLYNFVTEAHQIRALDWEKYCVNISVDENGTVATVSDFYWQYGDRSNMSEKNLLVIWEEDFRALPQIYAERYIYLSELSNGMRVYAAESTPWDFVSGLPEYGDRAVDYAYSNGYSYDGEILDGALLVEGHDAQVLWGPYTATYEGNYNISFYYHAEDISDSFEAYVEVGTANGTAPLATGNLEQDEQVLHLENIWIPSDETLELKVWASEGSNFRLEQIEIEKIE